MLKIFIDPGHGGKDPGAEGNGLQEKDINLQISLEIREMLKQYENVSVKMSRTNDQTVSLVERTNAANSWESDFYLSIHINSGNASGFESFVYPGVRTATINFQRHIHTEVINQTLFKDRGIKQADFHVLRESKMDAVLTENGFITSETDTNNLKSMTFIKQIAAGHVNGLVKAFHLKKKPSLETEDVLYRVVISSSNNKYDLDALDKESNLRSFETYVFKQNGEFYVQIGAFKIKKNAEELVEKAKKKGLNPKIIK